MAFDLIIIRISQASVLIPLYFGLLNYNKLNRSYKIFVYYFVLSVLIEIAASIVKNHLGNNLFILHIFVPIEFIFFAYLFYEYFESRRIKIYIYFAILLLISCAVVNVVFNGFKEHNSLPRSLESIFLILLTLGYFYQYFRDNNEVFVYLQPMFWLCSGVLIYYSIDFFSFMLINQLLKQNFEIAQLSKMIHAFINIIAYVFYALSFKCFQKMK